jgi:hypothetical protein
MSDEIPHAKPRQALGLLSSHHVSAAHAPKPHRRVVPATEPRRIVTYDGVEFEVAYDGVDRHVIVDEVR